MRARLVRGAVGGVTLGALYGTAACGSVGQAQDLGAIASAERGFGVGLLLPGVGERTDRDRRYVQEELAAQCPKCRFFFGSANNDLGLQLQQVDLMIIKGAKVIILESVDDKAIASAVTRAHRRGVKIVAYDRLPAGPVDAYTSFDNVQVGREQGKALLAAIRKGGHPRRGDTVMINGSPTDPNTAEFKKGALSVLRGKVKIARSYDTPDWRPDLAAAEAATAFMMLGPARIVGVYCANDGMAGGVSVAMRKTGVRRGTPLTGQDAGLDAIQRILLGTQTMTVYKPIRQEAKNAVRSAVALGTGKRPPSNRTVSNPTGHSVPASIISPVAVDRSNIRETVVKDGFWTVPAICTPEVAAACRAAGLT
ncbi:substrate-binding domain-containing protein [Actinoallomurus sp. NPDC050550]|uniref:sugar ABC transporter substrate-binding protein n=1 Tax=Actinoallomurus sp. NPDC050550 TaxID=3154937 RepID=UPI0033D96D3D